MNYHRGSLMTIWIQDMCEDESELHGFLPATGGSIAEAFLR